MDFLWRLEGPHGSSPYQGPYLESGDVRGFYWDADRHPAPVQDYDRRTGRLLSHELTDAHRFGFSSVTQARQWWSSKWDLAEWERRGFHLVAYNRDEVTGVHETEHQAVFIPTPSAHKAELPPTHLFSEPAAKLAEEAAHAIGAT